MCVFPDKRSEGMSTTVSCQLPLGPESQYFLFIYSYNAKSQRAIGFGTQRLLEITLKLSQDEVFWVCSGRCSLCSSL